MTEQDMKWISKSTKQQMEEYKKLINHQLGFGLQKSNKFKNKLVDVLDPSKKTRNEVVSKLKKLTLVIGTKNEEDWDFVNTLIDGIVIDGGVPTELELKQCNNLWRKYNVK